MEIADVESYAASRAIRIAYLLARKQANKPNLVYLYIDSQAAIQRLQNNTFETTQLASKDTQKLLELGIKLTIIWCPSHIGIEGNELADKLAKQALDKPTLPIAYTSISFLRSKIHSYLLNLWNSKWKKEGSLAGRQYTAITLSLRLTRKPNPFTQTTFNTRSLLSSYIQLKTGFGFFKRHL